MDMPVVSTSWLKGDVMQREFPVRRVGQGGEIALPNEVLLIGDIRLTATKEILFVKVRLI